MSQSPLESKIVNLSSVLGGILSFPSAEAYESSLKAYFSQQNSDIKPLCIVSPTTVDDVSTAITALASTIDALNPEEKARPLFAVRSGGHSCSPGASNINGGVTIDLRSLNAIEVSDDRSTVSIGVGAKWGDVYAKVEPMGISVAGGRVGHVGVGGLTLGGGISHFSPRYGWTCDTVSNFEVVLADGSIVNANERENPELMTALRGGANNFGIVTRVELKAFEQGLGWGGNIYYSLDTIDEHLKAFVDFNSAENYDEYASLITNFGYVNGQGAAVMNTVNYTKAEENPVAFRPFTEIPSLFSTTRIASMHELVTEQGSFVSNGRRQLYVTTTHGSTLPMLQAVYREWNTSLAAVQDIPGVIWPMSLEPLPPAIYGRAASQNSLGFSEASGALVVTLLSATWDDEAHDALMERTARELFDRIEAEARKLGVYEPFVYLNYAAQWQDPISSYGPKSVESLQQLRDRVDPKGMFRSNVSGFKIPE